MSSARRKRFAFRPSVDAAGLEERTVPTTIFDLGQGVTAVVPPPAPWASTLGPPVAAQLQRQARQLDLMETRQFQRAYQQQVRLASADLQQFINAEVGRLYAAGTPTAQQLADFNATVGGALNATALRLSSQAALLPGSQARLLPSVQNTLLGSARNTLPSQIAAITGGQGRLAARNLASPQALGNALGRQLNQSFRLIGNQFNSAFAGNALARQSVDNLGQRIPISQFLGTQLINQFGNTFGALGSSFGTMGNSMLFADGATAATPEALAAFQSQYLNALGTAAFGLGSALSVFPNGSTLAPQLQTAFFGTPPTGGVGFPFPGTPSTADLGNFGFFGNLAGLPTTATDFGTAAGTAFNTGFTNLSGSLSSFFGLPATTTFNLPTGNFTNLFGQQFLDPTFNGGFNGGFGSGFLGFGTPTADFNPIFGSGFNSFVGGLLPSIGFTLPTLSTAPIGGVGTTPGGVGTTPGGTGSVPTPGGDGLGFPF